MVFYQKVRWLFFEKSQQARRARWWLKAGFLAALFGILFWIVPFSEVFAALLAINLILFFYGFIFALLASFLTALEMYLLTRKLGIPYHVFQIFALNLSVKFYSLVAPTTLVGSGVRWYRLSQPTGKPSTSLASLFFFRSLEIFLEVTFGVFFWLLSNQQPQLKWNGVSFIALILLVFAFWMILVRGSSKVRDGLRSTTRSLRRKKAWQWLLEKLDEFVAALGTYNDMRPHELGLAIFAGIASLVASVASSLFFGRALGLELTFLQMGWISSVVLLVTQLPFAGIGGLGVREVSLVTIMPLAGVQSREALAFSFLLFVKGVLISLMGGVVEFVRLVTSRRAD